MTIDERIARAEAMIDYAVINGSGTEISYWAGYLAGLNDAKRDIVSAEEKSNGK